MRFTQIEKWRAITLAKGGWFSHRYIAARVLRKHVEEVTDAEARSVGSMLNREEVSVRKARDGKTKEARAHAAQLEKAKKKEKHKRKAG